MDKQIQTGPIKPWWSGSPEVEPYMFPVYEAISRHVPRGEARTDIYNRAYEAVHKAIQDCRAQPPNNPLTLDELRGMEVSEWIWIEILDDCERKRAQRIRSAYYQVSKDFTEGHELCCGYPGLGFCFNYDDHSTTWSAYRRKPEGTE